MKQPVAFALLRDLPLERDAVVTARTPAASFANSLTGIRRALRSQFSAQQDSVGCVLRPNDASRR